MGIKRDLSNQNCCWLLIISGKINASEDSEMVWECSLFADGLCEGVLTQILLLQLMREKRKWV